MGDHFATRQASNANVAREHVKQALHGAEAGRRLLVLPHLLCHSLTLSVSQPTPTQCILLRGADCELSVMMGMNIINFFLRNLLFHQRFIAAVNLLLSVPYLFPLNHQLIFKRRPEPFSSVFQLRPQGRPSRHP